MWRSSAAPFTTSIPARRWADALGLIDPPRQGARRVITAFDLLEDLNLVTVTRTRGDASEIRLCDESGVLRSSEPRPYTLPYDALMASRKRQRGRKPRGTDHSNLYFKVPAALWTKKADIQRMSPAALSLLLAYLNEARIEEENPEVWWSTNAFPDRYHLSSSMRTRGTKELVEMNLLHVKKRSVGKPGLVKSFSSERVRNVYVATRRLRTYMEHPL